MNPAAASATPTPTRLRQVRVDRNRTQDEIADAIGVSTVTLRRIESGTSNLTLGQFIAACQALDADPREVAPVLEKILKTVGKLRDDVTRAAARIGEQKVLGSTSSGNVIIEHEDGRVEEVPPMPGMIPAPEPLPVLDGWTPPLALPGKEPTNARFEPIPSHQLAGRPPRLVGVEGAFAVRVKVAFASLRQGDMLCCDPTLPPMEGDRLVVMHHDAPQGFDIWFVVEKTKAGYEMIQGWGEGATFAVAQDDLPRAFVCVEHMFA